MPLSGHDYGLELGTEGQIMSTDVNSEIVGTQYGFVNGDSGIMPFGRLVFRNFVTPERLNQLSSGQQVNWAGFTVASDRFSRLQANVNNGGYASRETVSVMRQGIIVLISETAMVRGTYTNLFVRFTDNTAGFGVNALRGRIRAGNPGDGLVDPIPANWIRILDNAAIGVPFRAEIKFPNA